MKLFLSSYFEHKGNTLGRPKGKPGSECRRRNRTIMSDGSGFPSGTSRQTAISDLFIFLRFVDIYILLRLHGLHACGLSGGI